MRTIGIVALVLVLLNLFSLIFTCMFKSKRRKIYYKLFLVIISALTYSFSVKLLIQQNNFFSGGVTGISLIISRLLIGNENKQMESVLYSLIHFALNIPIFILGFKSVGKKFSFYSFIQVVLVTVFVSIIPIQLRTTLQLDKLDSSPLVVAILAGLIVGFGTSLSFKNGYSGGGSDIISIYFMKKKGKNVGSYMFIFNIFVLITAGILFRDLVALIYTSIYIFVNSVTVDLLYVRNKKVRIQIISDNIDDVAKAISEKIPHMFTIADVVGAFSKNNKKQISIIVSYYELKETLKLIENIDSKSFVNIIELRQLYGKFYLPPIE